MVVAALAAPSWWTDAFQGRSPRLPAMIAKTRMVTKYAITKVNCNQSSGSKEQRPIRNAREIHAKKANASPAVAS